MANPFEFLINWSRDNVNATAYDDEGTAETMAAQCLSAARNAGFGAAGIFRAAGGNLVSFFLGEQDGATNRELDRLCDRD